MVTVAARRRIVAMWLGAVAAAAAPWMPLHAQGQAMDAQDARLHEPLPLQVVVSVHGHNGRSPIHFSPDGQWIAHTVTTDETVPRDARAMLYSPTGVPFGEGDSRMEATLTHTRTGEKIRLGGPGGTSWAPVWSPDGERVAFYSDQDGEAGLWIWERASGTAWRFPGAIVRPLFGFEQVRWSNDGLRVLVKLLAGGLSIAQANAMDSMGRASTTRFPDVPPGQPSVLVRRHEPAASEGSTAAAAGQAEPADESPAVTDLAVVDLKTRRIERLAPRARVLWYAFSPDQRFVAYTVSKGPEPNTQQSLFDLVVVEAGGNGRRVLIGDVRLGYGIECNWSPDSRAIACIESGQLGSGRIVSVTVADGEIRRFGEGLAGGEVPSFNSGQGEYPPLWSADSTQLFAIGKGELWRIDVQSGQGAVVGRIPGQHIQAVAMPYGRPAIWTTNGGRTAWVVARAPDGAHSVIHAIDLDTGCAREVLRETKVYAGLFSLGASDVTEELAFVSTGQQHLPDIWLLDTRDSKVRRATRLNPELDRYALGQARVLHWRGIDGEPLAGTLLLPPGYRDGQRLPLVVNVYGGAMGSQSINYFGGRGGSTPMLNMHVLVTRGYAVLFPDAPLRQGRTMTDIVPVVMAGVDAAIEAGYADPRRLAVIGQSYGSFNTLSLIAQTTRFRAASITAAVIHPDLFAAYLGGIGYYEQGQGSMGGSIWEHHERYAANSPLFLFDRIETPLLIGQGERDGDLVPANAIFTALQRLDKPVELRVYEAEGHVITQKPNVIDFWRRRLDFFAGHLDLALDENGAVIVEEGEPKGR
jgi:dipeptidyl aminopeptidase/acylaminoacyl peptidase